tara:strand:+ start:608 stop:1114 length:507 start_codon:yes stop_codon:yes gene_type:complete
MRKLRDLIALIEASDQENELSHGDALATTGFWGNAGAGALFVSRDTGRILFAHRSSQVEQPGTWGGWGGAIDEGESPTDAVKREAHEEAGINISDSDIIPLYVFKHESGFRYFNFLVLVDHEFTPHQNWETQGYDWVKFGDWPQQLHFGIKDLLNDKKSFEIIKRSSR